MKALILNGSPKCDPLAEKICVSLFEELKEQHYEGNLLNLADIEIAPCLGCFGCWVKTPGVCVIDDAGRNVARTYIQSGMVVFISPITFGGYSYELKKVFDRLIPILSPFFKNIGGEIHHKMRYKRYPRFLVIGVQLPSRNSKAFHQARLFPFLQTRASTLHQNQHYTEY